jgi:hypothetical protein
MHIVIVRLRGSAARLYSKPMPLAQAEAERDVWNRRHNVVAEMRPVPRALRGIRGDAWINTVKARVRS